ncbi:MAG: ATP-binding protein [Sneathiellales bacterium]|nr:ATP-binding protein [Sneathiellales bacterium]
MLSVRSKRVPPLLSLIRFVTLFPLSGYWILAVFCALVLGLFLSFQLPDWKLNGASLFPLQLMGNVLCTALAFSFFLLYIKNRNVLARTTLFLLCTSLAFNSASLFLPDVNEDRYLFSFATRLSCLAQAVILICGLVEEFLVPLKGKLKVFLGVAPILLAIGFLVILSTSAFLNLQEIYQHLDTLLHIAALAALIASLMFLLSRGSLEISKLECWLFGFCLFNIAVLAFPYTTFHLPHHMNQVNHILLGTVGHLLLLGGLTSIVLALLNRENKHRKILSRQNESAQLLYSSSMVIANAEDFSFAALECAKSLYHFGNWKLVHLIIIHQDDSISHRWYSNGNERYDTFISHTEEEEIHYGEGFSGGIWASQQQNSISNIALAKNFSRAKEAAKAGLVHVYGLPVTLENETLAIFEFYDTAKRNYDAYFYNIAISLADQLRNMRKRCDRIKNLEDQEKSLQEMFDKFPAGLAAFDQDDRLSLYNEKFSTLSEQFEDYLRPGMEFSDLATRIAYSGLIETAVGNEQEWIQKTCLSHKSGHDWVEHRYSDGRFMQFSEIKMPSGDTLGVWADVTEVRENEQNLLKMTEMLKASLSGFPGGICIFDNEMRISFTNENLFDLLSLDPEKLPEEASFYDFLDFFRLQRNMYSEFVSELLRLHVKLMSSETRESIDSLSIGSKVFALHAASMPTGGFVLSFIDITERQNYEISLREAKKAAEKSAKLAKELAKTAEAANLAKSQFLATMSHEIRTPMNGMLATLDLLRGTVLTEVQSRYLKTVKSSAKTLLRLLNDILDLSKIEADQFSIEAIPFDIRELMTMIEEYWHFQSSSKKLDFIIQLDPLLPTCMIGDPHRLHQILNNLIGNAIKFTSEGSVTVSINCVPAEIRDETDGRLLFEVTDTGIGVSEEHQAKLFKKFSQADATTTRLYGGSGLGLAICKEIVSMMGGEIGLDSTEEHGTTVWFELDLKESSEKPEPLGINRKDRDLNINEYLGPKLKVLVAEDHPVNQAVLKEILNLWGHEATLANNGTEAVQFASENDFDLILMDIQMPELDGLEATKTIRNLDHKSSRIPIIAVTANATLEDEEKCLNAGMNDFISKPIEHWELKDTLLNYSQAKDDKENRWKINTHQRIFQQLYDREFDPAPLQELTDVLGSKIVLELVNKMVVQYEEQRKSVIDAYENEDHETLAREAHMLKSTFGQFGLYAASAVAIRIDGHCKDSDYQDALHLVPEMIEQCDQAVTRLRHHANDNLAVLH